MTITIAGTPPREVPTAAAARKRGRPDFGQGSASSFSSAAAAGSSVPSSSLFQPATHITCSPSPHGQPGFMPLVSPFADRPAALQRPSSAGGDASFASPLLRLAPVPEEARRDANFNFSQTSIASSVTFAPSHTSKLMSDGVSCRGNGASSGNGEMLGAMVGGAVDSVVGCSVRGGSPSSLSSGEYTNDHGMVEAHHHHEQQECLPPAKRARSGDYQFRAATQSVNGDGGASPMDMACDSPGKKFGACLNLRMNVDKPRGPCCHVCSTEADSAESAAMGEGQPGQNEVASAPAPRSRSLLSYFHPTAKKPTPLNAHTSSAATTNCPTPSNLTQCRYCDKLTCAPCARPCERCRHRFCTFCTKVNYAASVERILCFECDEQLSGVGGGGNGDSDCDMMDL